jgi:hypothetical protein
VVRGNRTDVRIWEWRGSGILVSLIGCEAGLARRALGWILLVVLVAALIAAVLI